MNSKECIKNAQECMEQAGGDINDEAKVELLRIAMEWLQLAEEIESLSDEARGAPVTPSD